MASIVFTSAGGVEATSFKATSTRMAKRNVQPTLYNGLDIINKTKVVDFIYREDEENEPHVGFIAEETDPILSSPNQEHMDINNCIGILIKAVQELSTKVDKLENEIKKLKE